MLASGIAEAGVEKRPYASYVAECLDLLIEHGTDRYGSKHNPFLVTILDVRTRACPEAPPQNSAPWRGQWRDCFWKPRGSDLLVDQSTIEVLYLLTALENKPKYRRFAEEYQRAVMQSPDEKGFFWWGWHRFYDVFDDKPSGSHGNYHEIHINLPRWDLLWQLDPAATRRELEAVWQWHVIDKATGEINRHGDGRKGCDFAMSAAHHILAFAFLHKMTSQPEWLQRARLVADYYWQRRDPRTNLIANRPNAGLDRFDGSHFDTSIVGLYCPYLFKAYELTGDEAFRDQAAAYLRAYARLGYDASAGKFWGSLRLDGTPEPGPRVLTEYAQYEPRGHIDLWQPYQLGYEHSLSAAQAYAYAYQVTRDPEMLTTARRWADWIRRDPPSAGCLEKNAWYADYARRFAPHGTFAELYGRAISLDLHLYALTGEQPYLDEARRLAREAVSRLYYRGLLRGHPAKPFYCSVDGVGFLLKALVQLDLALSRPKSAVAPEGILLHPAGPRITWENW